MKMNRKGLLVCILIFVLLVSIVGCGNKTESKQAASPTQTPAEKQGTSGNKEVNPYTKENPLVIRVAHGDKNLDPYISNKHVVAVLFKDFVESASGNRIKVEIHGGTLGAEKQLIESTQMGMLEATVMSDGPLTGFFAPLEVVYTPYLFANEVIADAVFDGPFGKELSEAIRKQTGLRVLAITENAGFRHFVNSKKPVRSPEDLNGLKIRTVESAAQMKLVELMGAAPTPVSWAETYTALQTRVVDGLNNNAQGILLGKLQEVQKYITLDGHTYSPGFLLVNDPWFEKLPSEFKNILIQGATYAKDGSRVIVRLAEATGYQKLAEAGMEVYKPTAEEKAKFKEKGQKAFLDWISGKVDKAWIDKVMKAVQEAEAQVKAF